MAEEISDEELALRAEYFDNDKYSGIMSLQEFFNMRGFKRGNKAGGRVKAYKKGGLARKKRSIARGCGAVMGGRRKKTLYI
tara:strand:+ start:345 stop:587 length:243 start_codon:yes stop_codon:yes gene_type:complete